MDENFLIELASDGEKKFSFAIPLGMSMGDAFQNLEGTVNEVIKASSDWKDTAGLRSMVVIEAVSWREVFKQALASMGDDAPVISLSEGGAEKLLAITQSASKLMKHFFIQGQMKSDDVEMFFVFRMDAGPRFISSVDFG